MILGLGAIAARMIFIQAQLTDLYASEFDRTVERFEPIASHDGRIIAAGGEVLAEDRDVFSVKVHYRWLEEPPDTMWLKGQALARLDRQARRDRERVARETQAVLQSRERLWTGLAQLTGLSRESLSVRRNVIQRRVEQIYALVDERRNANENRTDTDASAPSSRPLWQRAWQAIVAALTTPPERDFHEPLVIREQLDYHVLLSDVPLETIVEIEAHPEQYPGTRLAVTTRRIYPQGPAAAHLVGFRTSIDDRSLKERRVRFPGGDPLDYQPGDRVGKIGLERQYERDLRGLRGLRKLLVNRRGEVLRTEVVREPRYGRDLILALHLPLQQAAEALLDDVLESPHDDETNGKPLPIPTGGALVALDVRTGAVLAAASAPRFDLGLLVDPDAGRWQEVLDDSRKPLFHRAAEMALPPGSVFKVLSAIAFLESGKIDPERPFRCQGYLDDPDRYRCLIFRNFGASHGELNLADALAQSCNVYFFSAARRIGAEPICQWAEKLGFGRTTGIDLPGERAGTLLKTEPGAPRRGKRSGDRSASAAMQLSIGQGKLTVTPLQVARLIAAVANGGQLVTPRLLDSAGLALSDIEGSALNLPEPHSIEGLSSRTLEWLRMGLEQAVADRRGTGFRTVRLDALRIAGKTGTAEAGGGKHDHAWFAGYVPAERPKIAFVVVLEHAGSGGHAAGPLARKFVEALLAQGLLETRTIAAPSAN
jgi:penicillin-binding protein 2